MLGLFYRANFCSECGNPMKRERWWQHRYLCIECVVRGKHYQRIVLYGTALCLMMIFFLRSSQHHLTANERPRSNSTVSALDTSSQHSASLNKEKPQRVYCGARTQRGTSCRHLVLPGERCTQHRGRASMLDNQK